MNTTNSNLQALQNQLPDLAWITDPARVARLSQDFYWFSPVLKALLDGKVAEAVVRPRNEDELRALVGGCVTHRVPITLRGGGTGNYGQSTPLRGGVVVDMGDFKQVCWIRDGAGRAQAGIRLGDFDNQARDLGWEMRCIPSTFRIASLGGFFGGGFGGIGSINYGPLGSAGNVLGIRAMTVEVEPRIIELRGPEALMLHHAWGTNGIVLELEMALAPALPWREMIITFDKPESAMNFSNALAMAPGVAKKNICVWLHPIPRYLKRLAEYLPEGRDAVGVVVAAANVAAVTELALAHGGRITYEDSTLTATAQNRTILEYAWNHTTLHALKVDKQITYLQVSLTAGQHLQQVDEVRRAFGDEVMLHLEFIRSMDGQTTCTALPLLKYRSPEHIDEVIARFCALGIRVNNPHVNVVEDGKFGGVVPPDVLAQKKRFDPSGLLNPGKLRSWVDTGVEMTP